MPEELKFKFLKDVPLGNSHDGIFGFYHNDVAPALKEILENDTCVHTIGLFSKWGTGKSTLIEMIRNDLGSPMFVFDAWKYQEDSLRRIFLIELVNFLIDQKQLSPEDKKLLDPLYKSTEEQQEIIINEPHKQEKWFKRLRQLINIHWPFSLVISLALIWVALNLIFSKENTLAQAVKDFMSFIASISILALIFKPLFEKIWERSVDRFLFSLQPLASIKTRVEKEERLNSPEQFEYLFKQILQKIEKKIVIVFDNIDRVQGDAAIKILSTVKTFLDPSGVAGLVFVVPCDSEAIINQIRSFYDGNISDAFDPSEYLRKLFNVIVWTPEFIEADLHAYIKKVIDDTGDVKELLDNEDLFQVVGAAFSSNPREIKQFINNLIAALVLASKTEVWERIKSNVPYLAKVLILKQKYPEAFSRLKLKWFEPENILDKEELVRNDGLRNFMLNTSRFTVNNARPFIYFKEPTIYRSLNDSEGLILSLAEGNKEKFKELTSSETDHNALFGFIQNLLKDYRTQKEILLKIFITHLEAFNELKITTTSKRYYEALARVLDSDLWQFFTKLPTNLVFSDLVTKQELDTQFRTPLIKRYALAVGNEDLRKPAMISVLKDILINLKQDDSLIAKEDKTQIVKFIEEHFSNNFEVISIFTNLDEQTLFISPQAFDKFIASLNRDSLSGQEEIIKQFKEYIIKKNKFGVLLQKITEIVNTETTENPDYRAEKETLFSTCGDIFSEFQDQLKNSDDATKIQLVKNFIQAFNSIGSWNNRTCLVNNLRWISFYAPEAQKNELVNQINAYFQNASAAKIGLVFDYWKKESAEKFLSVYSKPLLSRSINDDALLEIVYKKADKDKKIELLQDLINQKGANCINFLKNLGSNLPDRQAIVKSLLTKVTSIAFGEQIQIYDYLPEQLSKNDPVELKDQAITQIKNLIKSDTLASQEAGFNFLRKSEFLSEEKKREIAKEVLDWLRQPGKVLSSAHHFALKTISSLTEIMQETPVKDFVYTLFDMLRQERDKNTLQTALGILDEVKPTYALYEKDFKDLLARLKDWPENENRTFVIERIKGLKTSAPKKEEKDFWKEFESLTIKEKPVTA
ncbi:MAG: P-loop NTPase fold protein [Patescibacteria group bacterium]|nr:P-loop NTPase fold protein [Patescibacteria group bacterium]MDD5120989.1 P-loop NTPase fold protein [Patescibacteria group bacterium]MDD5396092.1 P-loop NTPase fold protein [Patescibacteria group bacterium]